MTIATARFVLAIVWCVLSLPIMLFVAIQTFSGVYGGDGEKGLLWIFPALVPQISTVLTSSIVIRKSKRLGSTFVSLPVFITTASLSLLYLAIVYAAIWIGIWEFRNANWDYIFRMSTLFLIFLQGIFLTAYTAYFFEKT